jgi:hypothetical protein
MTKPEDGQNNSRAVPKPIKQPRDRVGSIKQEKARPNEI